MSWERLQMRNEDDCQRIWGSIPVFQVSHTMVKILHLCINCILWIYINKLKKTNWERWQISKEDVCWQIGGSIPVLKVSQLLKLFYKLCINCILWQNTNWVKIFKYCMKSCFDHFTHYRKTMWGYASCGSNGAASVHVERNCLPNLFKWHQFKGMQWDLGIWNMTQIMNATAWANEWMMHAQIWKICMQILEYLHNALENAKWVKKAKKNYPIHYF
jgi:hypothetical protein